MDKRIIKKNEITEKEVVEYVLEKFQNLKKSKSISELVNFQTRNKYLIMAHNQEKLYILGNLVANHKKDHFDHILNDYEKELKSALSKKPTINSHLNVIMHFFGRFAKKFTKSEKDFFIEITRQFKEENISVGQILSEIEPLIYRFNNTYLANQTYFLLYASSQPGVLFSYGIRNYH